MTIALWLAAAFNAASAVFHIAFWKMFDWSEDLKTLRPENRGIIQTLNVVLIYIMIGAAVLCAVLAGEPELDGLARSVLAFNGGLYLLRAAVEFPLFGKAPLAQGISVIAICGLAGAGYVAIALAA